MPKRNSYANQLAPTKTPQSQQADSRQVPNNAGGWAFEVDKWTQARRFLILGSEGGTYYIGERDLTLQNAKAIQACLQEDGLRLVNLIIEVSASGLAPKNSPAIFALALACSPKFADKNTVAYALQSLHHVLRILPHMFEFLEAVRHFRGMGRALRTAIGAWFDRWSGDTLGYQLVKYRQRDGWTARDVLRLAHISTNEADKDAALRWAVGGMEALQSRTLQRKLKEGFKTSQYGDVTESLPAIIKGYELISGYEGKAGEPTTTEAAELIRAYHLPREAVPTSLLNESTIWAELLKDMPYTALMRNVATMTRVGLTDEPDQLALMVERLTNEQAVRKSLVHPIAILAALKTYAQGHGMRGGNTWKPHPRLIDALDKAYYMAFANVDEYNGRVKIAIDVSGSMDSTHVVGLEYLSCVEGAAALSLPMLARMPNAFTEAFDTEVKPLALSSRQRLDDAARAVQRLIHGGTNCALPIITATSKKQNLDAFVIVTDSETWAGSEHPHQAMKEYRAKVNPNAKLAVIAMCSNKVSIADPEDALSMNLIGFDTNTPVLLDAFLRGNI